MKLAERMQEIEEMSFEEIIGYIAKEADETLDFSGQLEIGSILVAINDLGRITTEGDVQLKNLGFGCITAIDKLKEEVQPNALNELLENVMFDLAKKIFGGNEDA